jgi:ATP-dependent Clp protease adaptor protein ClpS
MAETDVFTEEQLDVLEVEKIKDQRELILYNDDYHTFDFVIESLVKVCRHTLVQAEQCTYIVHYKGKCSVKKGEEEKLQSMCTALLDRGLSAEIQ